MFFEKQLLKKVFYSPRKVVKKFSFRRKTATVPARDEHQMACKHRYARCRAKTGNRFSRSEINGRLLPFQAAAIKATYFNLTAHGNFTKKTASDIT